MKAVHIPLILIPAGDKIKQDYPGVVGVLPVFLSHEEAIQQFPGSHVSECDAKGGQL